MRIAHPDKDVQLWFMDEMRVGQKGRTAHRWWIRGKRPAGCCDKRFASAYLFGAARIGTNEAFALALPFVSTAAMQVWLDAFAATLAPGTHAALVLDRAGWHGATSLIVPASLTLIALPAYSPELNPIERLWLLPHASAISPTACSLITTPSSTPAAEPGTPSKPRPAASPR